MLRAVLGGWVRHGGKGTEGPVSAGGSPASEPTASLAAGKYDRAMTQSITLSTSSGGASIYYTTDGSTPTTSSTLYTGAIPVDTTTTIKALASGGGFTDSTVFSATYTILSPQLYVTGNGFNAGTSFADTSGYAKTITTQGNAQTSTAHSFYGGSSILLDGTGDGLTLATSTDFGFGTGDFIVTLKARATSLTSNRTIIDFRSAEPQVSPLIYCNAGTIYYWVNGANRITGSVLSTATDYTITLTRVSGVTKLYVNGAQVGSSYTDANDYSTTRPLGIGCYSPAPSSIVEWAGYLGNVWTHKGNGLSDAEALAWYNANVAFAPHPDLLLHMDGTNGSTTFTDSSNSTLTVTANGNAQLATANPKFGTAAGLFDGVGDWLTLGGQAAFAFGSSDFTIEFWARPTSTPATATGFVDMSPATTNGAYPNLYMNTSLKPIYNTNSADRITATTALVLNTYSHIAAVRKANVTTLYVDGVSQGTYTDTTVYLNGASRPMIAAIGYWNDYAFPGNIDELQIIKGFAKYDGNFTPPTRAFVN